MSSKRVAAQAVTLRRLQEFDSGLGLLRKETLPVVASVLNEHLGGQQRIKTAAEFLELLEGDLSALRDYGFDLPRSAQEYLADWVSARLIIRRPGEGREETVELSPSALAAIRFLADVESPRSSVTSSRLSNVADLLSSLARDTDPDSTSYVEALWREKERIERVIADVDAGRYQPISDSEALERLAEIMHLASEVPGDFARVSDNIERLNKSLREQIIQQDGTRGEILGHVFDGVDTIESSEEGRSFSAFYNLVLDPEQANNFDDSVDAVLSRGFALALSDVEVVALRCWLSALQAESSQVRDVMTGLARSLRRFVESHAFREHRRLAESLAEAKLMVLEASRRTRPQTYTNYELPASSVSISSISSWSLHDPSEARVERPVKTFETQPLDLGELRKRVRLSEIDFDELRQTVAKVLDQRVSASIAEIFESYPATQGLASVIGLMVLADAVGMISSEDESLSWTSEGGQLRTVRVARRIFHDVPNDWGSA
jgi:hypothetical protein